MNRLEPMQINSPAQEAADSRIRQAVELKRAIDRAEANVWRRKETVKNTKPGPRRNKALRKLEIAEDKLIRVKITGSAKQSFSWTRPPTPR